MLKTCYKINNILEEFTKWLMSNRPNIGLLPWNQSWTGSTALPARSPPRSAGRPSAAVTAIRFLPKPRPRPPRRTPPRSPPPPPLNAILSPNLTTPNDPHGGRLLCFSTKKTPFGKEPGRPPPKGVIARQSLQGSHADPGLSGKDIIRPAERKAHFHQPFCKLFY